MKPSLLYIAQPYTHMDPAVMDLRAACGKQALAWMIRHGIPSFAPVPHTHDATKYAEIYLGDGRHGDHEYWMVMDKTVLARACNVMAMLALPGWRESRGLAEERDYCLEHNIAIVNVPWDDREYANGRVKFQQQTISGLMKAAAVWSSLNGMGGQE